MYNKLLNNKRKAFTLVELLIVIAIIGILFIVLVSKIDFASDRAKVTGVQTDFRSFQLAFEQVAREHDGFATFGWDYGDTNGNKIKDTYDEGDLNLNKKQDAGEVWTGHKVYGERWTNVYTLTNPANANDKSAIQRLKDAAEKAKSKGSSMIRQNMLRNDIRSSPVAIL
jgi:prepilin-type N-terminal cleavage/methylation domain-containing protein